MNHCIIMTVYKDVDNINRIISLVPNDWGIYIHIDKKSRIRKKDIDNRAKSFKRYTIYWGGHEHLKAIWRLIITANSENYYDYFHIVSGQDYFASNPNDFDQILGNAHNNYIGITALPADGWYWGDGGFDIFRYWQLTSFCDIRNPFWNKMNRKFITAQRLLHLERKLPSYPLAKGFVWSTLHRDFINWAINNPLSSDLLKRLRNSIVPEEVFFQTLLINSPYMSSAINNSLHFHEWVEPWPKILNKNDLLKIGIGENLFVRKISSEHSKELLDDINNRLFINKA